jgi:hypothetical protein
MACVSGLGREWAGRRGPSAGGAAGAGWSVWSGLVAARPRAGVLVRGVRSVRGHGRRRSPGRPAHSWSAAGTPRPWRAGSARTSPSPAARDAAGARRGSRRAGPSRPAAARSQPSRSARPRARTGPQAGAGSGRTPQAATAPDPASWEPDPAADRHDQQIAPWAARSTPSRPASGGPAGPLQGRRRSSPGTSSRPANPAVASDGSTRSPATPARRSPGPGCTDRAGAAPAAAWAAEPSPARAPRRRGAAASPAGDRPRGRARESGTGRRPPSRAPPCAPFSSSATTRRPSRSTTSRSTTSRSTTRRSGAVTCSCTSRRARRTVTAPWRCSSATVSTTWATSAQARSSSFPSPIRADPDPPQSSWPLRQARASGPRAVPAECPPGGHPRDLRSVTT